MYASFSSPTTPILLVVFTQDVASEIAAELEGRPDFIIGNYSDGNLVASLLAYKMGVTQVIIFHFPPYKLYKIGKIISYDIAPY